MIKIRNKPSYTIDVYEGSITIEGRKYEFRIDIGDSYGEIKWLTDYSIDFMEKRNIIEDQILEQFLKQQNG